MHPFTTWLALAGSVWALFAFAEDHINPEIRTNVAAWLRRRTHDWPGTLSAVWDSVFSPSGQAGRCGIRGCVALHVSAFLALCLSGVLYPGTSGVMLLVLFLYAPALLGLMAVVNLLPGYMSLRVNRLLLQAVTQNSPANRLLWLLLAGLATLCLALLGCALGFLVVHLGGKIHLFRHPVTWISGYVEFVLKGGRGSLSALQEAVQLQPILVPGIAFPSFGIWFYAPCFPLLWAWLYILSGTIIRRVTACRMVRGASNIPGLPYIDSRPLHSLGAVAVGVVSVVYWTAIYLGRS